MGFKKKTNKNRAKPKREKYRCRNGNCSIKGISPKKMEAIQLLPPTKTIWDPTVENDCDHEGNCRGNWVPKRFAEERVLSEWHKQQTRKKREPNFDGADISALIKELKDKGFSENLAQEMVTRQLLKTLLVFNEYDSQIHADIDNVYGTIRKDRVSLTDLYIGDE
tara:strand:- start:10756 stop:11250 length:495 start_codon:yes stop_codon:yes gene_type:complete